MKCHANRHNLPEFEGKFGIASQIRDLSEERHDSNSVNSACYITVYLSHTALNILNLKALLLQDVDFEYLSYKRCPCGCDRER